jgi:PST family polysaccharide transporter
MPLDEASLSNPAALPARAAEGKPPRRNTYGQILKSSALIGGASVLKIGLGMVRTKALALLLGPAGIGLLGLYGSIADLAGTIAGMGLNSSGVRQIAEAVGTGDTARIARTVTTLRRVALLLGLAGAALLLALCAPISQWTFRDHRDAMAVASLSLVVLFTAVSGGQLALVQGMRRIGDLVRASLVSVVGGLLVTLLIVFLMGQAGVAPSLVGSAAVGLAASWWYSRKVRAERVPMNWTQVSVEVSALLKLGFVFMASGFMSMGVACLVRIVILRRFGEDAAGFYQSAWTLGGLYVGFILQAMGADFFPRLTAAARDHSECNRLVNEQAEVGLLLAGPGVVGTLTLAPLVIQVFYSAKFGPAVEILRWICLGMLLRVASWPMGFILLAKGARWPFLWSELASNLVHVGLVWLGIRCFGLPGAGVAFFAGYVFYWCLIYLIVRSTTGFVWSAANTRICWFQGALISLVFLGWYVLPHPVVAVAGAGLTLVAGSYSLKRIYALVPFERLPGWARRILVWFGLAPANS